MYSSGGPKHNQHLPYPEVKPSLLLLSVQRQKGLGMLAIMEELEIPASLKVKSDAVAAIGIVKRQGLGRIRHLAVADLWVQQKSKLGTVSYEKLPGKDNTSDILTKPVDGETLSKHMEALGLDFHEGRHSLTPSYDGLADGTPE